MNDLFSVFLLFPVESINISSKEEGKLLLKDIQMILDRTDCEAGAQLYYCSSNKEAFSDILRIYEQKDMLGNFGFLDFEEALLQLFFEANIQDWEINQSFSDACTYLEYVREARYENDNIPAVMKEITERILTNDIEEKILLLHIDHDEFMSDPIQIKKVSEDQSAQYVSIPFVTNFWELDDWFNKVRSYRNYNHGDYRHIQNHPQYRYYYKKGVKVWKSPLLGGLGYRVKAEKILQTAVGDSKKCSYLINWDLLNKCYIRFEDENALNQYHGYHVVNYKTHERDYKEEKELPNNLSSG